MQKLRTSQLVNGVLGTLGFMVLLLAGLKTIFNWDWGNWFFMATTLAVGMYLLVESGIKSYKGFKHMIGSKASNGLIHVVSFGLGTLLIYIGIQMIPILGLPVMSINGWVLILGGAWAILEGFVK